MKIKFYLHNVNINLYSTFKSLVLITLAGLLSFEASAQTYCASSFSNTIDEWISSVDFAGINNPSGSTGYSDFTNLTATVSPGVTYPIDVEITQTNTLVPAWLEHAAVWIDWDQNFVFDPSEFVYLGDNGAVGPVATVSSTITVPATALPGTTRMRIRMQFDPPPIATDACNSGTFGEVEDYSITVLGSGPNDIGVLSIDSPVISCPGLENVVATINNFGTNQVTTGIVNWSVDGVSQTPASFSGLLDTVNGTGSTSAQVVLGSFNFVNNTVYDIQAWTSLPNGVADTVNINDSSETMVDASIIPPFGLSSNNVLANTANITWMDSTNASSWQYEWGTQGFAIGSGTRMGATMMSASIPGLIPSTVYDFYVRSICGAGDTSNWSSPGSFLTPCTSLNIPWTEDFNGVAPNIPICWTSNDSAQVITSATCGSQGEHLLLYGVPGNFALSPILDLTGQTSVEVFYDYRAGDFTCGETPDAGDSMAVEYFDGTSWVSLARYNGGGATPQTWTNANFLITTGLTANFQIRIICPSGSGLNFDSYHFDDMTVRVPPANDLRVDSLFNLPAGCNLTNNESIDVSITNSGSSTQNSYDIDYRINGGSWVNAQNVTTPIATGANFTTTISGIDLSIAGTYNIDARVVLVGDQDPTNDIDGETVISVPSISTFPYTEGFENDQGGWTVGGNTTSWQWGTPSNSIISGAANGSKAWVTDTSGLYLANEDGFVVSPCFDFTNIIRPRFDLNINWNAERGFGPYDGANLQYSTDGGVTWALVSGGNPQVNWYNTQGVISAPAGLDDAWSGRISSGDGSNGWVAASNALQSLGGESAVRLRMAFYSDGSAQDEGVGFDDFGVAEDALADDMQMDTIFGIASGCGLSAQTPVTVIVTNYGLNDQVNIPVSYRINGGTPVSETITDTLVGGQVYTYTFSQTADLSNPQVYTIDARVDLAGDGNPNNDSAQQLQVTSFEVPVVVFTQGAELCIQGPTFLVAQSSIGFTEWFDAASGGNSLGIGDTINIANLTGTITYYAAPTNGITGCIGPRVPVIAELSQVPQVDFTVTQGPGPFVVTFNSTLSANTDSVWWDFGYPGNVGTDDPNPVHTFPARGTYFVTLNAFDGSCDTAAGKAILATSLENILGDQVEIYPNPVKKNLNLEASGLSDILVVEIVDLKGRVILRRELKSQTGTYNESISIDDAIPSGSYLLRLNDGENSGWKKLIID